MADPTPSDRRRGLLSNEVVSRLMKEARQRGIDPVEYIKAYRQSRAGGLGGGGGFSSSDGFDSGGFSGGGGASGEWGGGGASGEWSEPAGDRQRDPRLVALERRLAQIEEPELDPSTEDVKPGYGYARDDMSTDHGRLQLNDPRMLASERKDRVMAEGRSLAASDIKTAKREGTLRRAREKPLGLYQLLTGGSPEDREYYESARRKMMIVPLEGGDEATRIRPGSNTAYSPSTGKWVDTTPRRVPEAIRRRRAAAARERDSMQPVRSQSRPYRNPKDPEDPYGGRMTGPLSPEDAEARRSVAYKRTGDIRRHRKAGLGASRAALQAKMASSPPAQGVGAFGPGVPTAPTIPHPFANMTPQWRRQHESRLIAGDKKAIALQGQADRFHEGQNRMALARHDSDRDSAKLLGGQEAGDAVDPGKPTPADYQTLGGLSGESPTSSEGKLMAEAAILWNTAGKDDKDNQQSRAAFLKYAYGKDNKWLAPERQAILLKIWYMSYQKHTGKEPGADAEMGIGWFESPITIPLFQTPGAHAATPPGLPGTTRPAPQPSWATPGGTPN